MKIKVQYLQWMMPVSLWPLYAKASVIIVENELFAKWKNKETKEEKNKKGLYCFQKKGK